MRASEITETFRWLFVAIDELDPSEQDEIVTALVAHLRARDPVAVSPLGLLAAPTEPVRDPRRGNRS